MRALEAWLGIRILLLLLLRLAGRVRLPLRVLLEGRVLAALASKRRLEAVVVVHDDRVGVLELFLRWHRRVLAVRLLVGEEIPLPLGSFTEWGVLQERVVLIELLPLELLHEVVVLGDVSGELLECNFLPAADPALLARTGEHVGGCHNDVATVRVAQPLRVLGLRCVLLPFVGRLGTVRDLELLSAVRLEGIIVLVCSFRLTGDLLAGHLEGVSDGGVAGLAE